ncbi:MAG: hypothetical protein PVSMB7_28310 [Chloroflexota bacterium]
MKSILLRLSLALILTVALAGTTIGISLPGSSNASTSTLVSGQGLTMGQSITSPNGNFSATVQRDGNLVVSSPTGPIWSSLTWTYPGAHLSMQSDGNLVLYGKDHSAIWNTRTYGQPGAYLTIGNDGNLVLYSSSDRPLWSIRQPMRDRLRSGDALQSNWIRSADGRYYLFMQGDGNLVLYTNQRVPLWNTHTEGHPGAYAIMQSDGNLVVYTWTGVPLWSSHTWGHPGAALLLENNAGIDVCSARTPRRALWQWGKVSSNCTTRTT